MAKKFYFDDEFDTDDFEYDAPVHKQSNKNITEDTVDIPKKEKKKSIISTTKKTDKKNSKKKWIILGIIGALVLGIIIYCIVVSMEKGPVYGKRCEGLVTEITESDTSKAVTKVKETYSEVSSIEYEIACKQVKIDIVFDSSVSAEDAEEIGEHAAIILDDVVGLDKQKNSNFSKLFGVVDGENQYEVNLYMENDSNEDFPIYGTKTAPSKKFGFTLASVRDESSKNKALETKEE